MVQIFEELYFLINFSKILFHNVFSLFPPQSLYLLSSLQRWAAELYHLHKLNPFVCCQVSELPQWQNIKISTEIHLSSSEYIWRQYNPSIYCQVSELLWALFQLLSSTEFIWIQWINLNPSYYVEKGSYKCLYSCLLQFGMFFIFMKNVDRKDAGVWWKVWKGPMRM